jgi:catechol 2,3-dioxygenase-like lactoylglutathione lyase family enzyme
MLLNHVSMQCADMTASAQFYDAVLATLGGRRIVDFAPQAIGYGDDSGAPEFWIDEFNSGDGFRESHFAFNAASRAKVREFFDTATGLGAEALHEPRLWPEYGETYYAAFVRDPDGNNVEAVCVLPE